MQRESLVRANLRTLSLIGLLAASCSAQTASTNPVPPVANPCQRPAAGSIVTNPPSLFSEGGVLAVRF